MLILGQFMVHYRFLFVFMLLFPFGAFLPQQKAAAHVVGSTGVIETVPSLDVGKLPAGRSDFYLSVPKYHKAGHTKVPVIALKGYKPGKTLMITAAIHGDELNGIIVIHRLFAQLEAADIAGTIVAVPGVNQAGLNAGSRFFTGTEVLKRSDLNRMFQTDKTGPAAEYARYLWQHLLRKGVDLAVDLHTQAEGAKYPLFVFADFANARVLEMAYALQPDVVKNDPGQKGTLETAYIEAGIPAVTLELGQSSYMNVELVERAAAGIINLLKAEQMLPGTAQTSRADIFTGTMFTDVSAEKDGFSHITVKLMDRVNAGDHVATMRDSFGHEMKRYYAPHEGVVLAVSTTPLRRNGELLIRILR